MTARTVAELRKWATGLAGAGVVLNPLAGIHELSDELIAALAVVEAADKYESIDMDNVTDREGVRLTVALCAAVRAWRESR